MENQTQRKTRVSGTLKALVKLSFLRGISMECAGSFEGVRGE